MLTCRSFRHRVGMSAPRFEDAVTAVRALFADTTPWVRDGIHPVEVVAGDGELLVVFRWRRNPHLYAFPISTDDLTGSPWTGEPVHSAEEWAGDVAGLIEEELLTGHVARATRRLVQGRIELREPAWPTGDDRFSVTEVEYGGMADWLEEVGLDITEPRDLEAAGRLLGWDALCLNDRDDAPVGSAATRWDDPTTARLVHLETLPGVPVSASLDLVYAAVCGAADAGATAVLTDLPVPHGEVLGFRAATDGCLRLDTDLLAVDHAAFAALLGAEPRHLPIDTGPPRSFYVTAVLEEEITPGTTCSPQLGDDPEGAR